MDRKSKFRLGGGAAAATIVAGLIVLAGVAPASAWNYTWRFDFGEARCSTSTPPHTQTMGSGEVKHQIGYNVAYSYGERYWNNGSSNLIRNYVFDSSYAGWATLSGIGYQNSKRWGCF